jgi:hypothetical protein
MKYDMGQDGNLTKLYKEARGEGRASQDGFEKALFLEPFRFEKIRSYQKYGKVFHEL